MAMDVYVWAWRLMLLTLLLYYILLLVGFAHEKQLRPRAHAHANVTIFSVASHETGTKLLILQRAAFRKKDSTNHKPKQGHQQDSTLNMEGGSARKREERGWKAA